MKMKKFEVGKTYTARSAWDHNCVWNFEIVGRTEQTVTAIDDDGKTQRYRINKKLSEYRNAESFKPFGNYSMSPTISAT